MIEAHCNKFRILVNYGKMHRYNSDMEDTYILTIDVKHMSSYADQHADIIRIMRHPRLISV